MYKDKAKQREAVRLATRRYRLHLKGITGVGVSQAEVVIPFEAEVKSKAAKTQSFNPLMVGYVPPQENRKSG